jgi:hypothetical protein
MKAIIGTAVGVLGLGGLVVASSGRTTSVDPAAQAPVVNSERAGATVVDCGDGREALVHPTANGGSRVECIASPGVGTVSVPFATQYASGAPQIAPAAPAVQERIVYRERPAARTTARRTTTAPASEATYSAAAPVYREPQQKTRSWKRSAVIIGGATAGGAGVGAVLDGKSGAKKGAVVGLVGGTVYDIATRNR